MKLIIQPYRRILEQGLNSKLDLIDLNSSSSHLLKELQYTPVIKLYFIRESPCWFGPCCLHHFRFSRVYRQHVFRALSVASPYIILCNCCGVSGFFLIGGVGVHCQLHNWYCRFSYRSLWNPCLWKCDVFVKNKGWTT